MPKSLKNIISAKFNREVKFSKQTCVFEKIDQEIQTFILSKAKLSLDQCIIIRYVTPQNWFLITIDFLLINIGETCEQIPYKHLIKVRPNIDLDKLNKTTNFNQVNINSIIIYHDSVEVIMEVEAGTAAVIVGILQYFIFQKYSSVKI